MIALLSLSLSLPMCSCSQDLIIHINRDSDGGGAWRRFESTKLQRQACNGLVIMAIAYFAICAYYYLAYWVGPLFFLSFSSENESSRTLYIYTQEK